MFVGQSPSSVFRMSQVSQISNFATSPVVLYSSEDKAEICASEITTATSFKRTGKRSTSLLRLPHSDWRQDVNPVTDMMNAIDLPGNRDRQLSQVERPDAPGQINNIWPCDINANPFQPWVALADSSLDMLGEWMVASGISTRDHTAPLSFESAKVLHLSRQRRKTHLPK